MNIFIEPNIDKKLKNLEDHLKIALGSGHIQVPDFSSRDVEILDLKLHPPKKGLSRPEGQARLLHDLASIELQAMELALRTLGEYPEAPVDFRNQLAELVLSEGKHLKMCLKGLNDLGYQWGAWPVHLALWNAVSVEDTLLERIFIVHRYLEGSGLDAADTLLRRLYGIPRNGTTDIVKVITDEEIGHVEFGNFWFRKICESEKLVPEVKFKNIIQNLRIRLPKRIEPVNKELRLKSKFTENEILELQKLRESFLQPLT